MKLLGDVGVLPSLVNGEPRLQMLKVTPVVSQVLDEVPSLFGIDRE